MTVTTSQPGDASQLVLHLAGLRSVQSVEYADVEDEIVALDRRIHGMIRGMARGLDAATVDDIAQEVWVKLVRRPPVWRSIGEFYGFVRLVVRSRLADWRSRRIEYQMPESSDGDDDAGNEPPAGRDESRRIDGPITAREFREALCLVVTDVEYPHRTIVFLENRVLGYKPAEIQEDRLLGTSLREVLADLAATGIVEPIREWWHATCQPLQAAMRAPVTADDYEGPPGAIVGETTFRQYCRRSFATCVKSWTEFVLRRMLRALSKEAV